MIILEFLAQIIVEFIFIELIVGGLSRLNNFIKKLRGIETKSFDEIKLEKLKKRYEYKSVVLIQNHEHLDKGTAAVVLELKDLKFAFVELKQNEQEIIEIPLRKILIKK